MDRPRGALRKSVDFEPTVDFADAAGDVVVVEAELDQEPTAEELAEAESALAEITEETDAKPEPGSQPEADKRYEPLDAQSQYMNEMSQTKLLTPQEEIELAAKIKRGDKKARERMIKANLRLVVSIAKGYTGMGLPLLDLVNEGNIGLMKAVERFDPAKGAKLSTYGSWWIKQSVKRALANQSKTIRIPVHEVDTLRRIKKTADRLEEAFGREPTNEEIAEEMDLPVAKVSNLILRGKGIASLDAQKQTQKGDDGVSLGDVIEDEAAEDPSERTATNNRLEHLREAMRSLTEREAKILTYRFGLDGGPERTLEDVGKQFKVTRERIRQIEFKAKRKIRNTMNRWEAQGAPEMD